MVSMALGDSHFLAYAIIRRYIVKLATVVVVDSKAPFSLATGPRCKEERYSFLWIAPLYL